MRGTEVSLSVQRSWPPAVQKPNRHVLRLVVLHEIRQFIQLIPFGRAGFCIHERVDTGESGHIVGVAANHLDVRHVIPHMFTSQAVECSTKLISKQPLTLMSCCLSAHGLKDVELKRIGTMPADGAA